MRPALGAVATVARWEMRGAARSRWVVGAAVLYGVAAVALALVGLRSVGVLGVGGVGTVVDGLVVLGVLLPPLFGLLLGAGAIAGAREQGLLALVAAQPIARWRIAWGTFIGLTATVWVSVAAGLGLVSVVLAPVVVLDDLASIGVAALATLAAAAVGVALGLLISASAAGRSQATALAAATWFVGALGIDIVVAAIAPSAFGAGGLLGVALINPIESVRLLALLLIDTEALGPFGGYLLDRFGAAGSVGMLGTSVVFWVLAPMWLATLIFRRRDV